MIMQRLIILGDSFSVPRGVDDPAETWVNTLGQHISELTGKPVETKNGSMVGSAQDWVWQQLINYMPYSTPDDYLMICLTHPSRFWFLKDLPQMTNVGIIDIDQWIDRDQERAIEGYLRYIQRPELDTQFMIQRMGWLAYQVKSRGLRRPLMVKCFRQEVGESADYSELNWANGNLFDNIQFHEFEDPSDEKNTDYWYGIDCRYNHMLLSNHRILTPRVADALVNDSTLDLTHGFIQGAIKEDSLEDQDFVNQELCPHIVEEMWKRRERENNRPIIPWLKKKRLADKIYSQTAKG
jgi:hypothetical protein